MSTLSDRIAWLHGPVQQSPNGDVDPGLDNETERSYKNYGTVKATPLVRVQVFPNGVIAYDEPIIAADGAPITATGTRQWGQLYAAGKY